MSFDLCIYSEKLYTGLWHNMSHVLQLLYISEIMIWYKIYGLQHFLLNRWSIVFQHLMLCEKFIVKKLWTFVVQKKKLSTFILFIFLKLFSGMHFSFHQMLSFLCFTIFQGCCVVLYLLVFSLELKRGILDLMFATDWRGGMSLFFPNVFFSIFLCFSIKISSD